MPFIQTRAQGFNSMPVNLGRKLLLALRLMLVTILWTFVYHRLPLACARSKKLSKGIVSNCGCE